MNGFVKEGLLRQATLWSGKVDCGFGSVWGFEGGVCGRVAEVMKVIENRAPAASRTKSGLLRRCSC